MKCSAVNSRGPARVAPRTTQIGRWPAEGPVNALHHLTGQGAFPSKQFQGVVGLPARIVPAFGAFHRPDDAVRIPFVVPDVEVGVGHHGPQPPVRIIVRCRIIHWWSSATPQLPGNSAGIFPVW